MFDPEPKICETPHCGRIPLIVYKDQAKKWRALCSRCCDVLALTFKEKVLLQKPKEWNEKEEDSPEKEGHDTKRDFDDGG